MSINTADSISLPLYPIFQRSLNSGEIPADLKKANICAIFKEGPKDECENYRPVCLTTQACKILETFIRDALCKHLELLKLIRRSQHGFISGKCYLTNQLEFLQFISKHVDKGLPVDGIYLDFKKAFDTVPHGRLMSKVKRLWC